MLRVSLIVCLTGMFLNNSWTQWRIQDEFRPMTPSGPSIQGLERQSETRSPLLAIGLSLILPGMGEWYAGNLHTGRYFLAADGALWLTYGAVRLQGTWIRDDARTFAGSLAQADFAGKDEQFEVNIGNFNTTEDYNQAKLRNREFDLLYSGSGFNWTWESEIHRLQYRALRIRSDEMFQTSRFVIGALVVNRIISAFSAWRSAANFNKENRFATLWKVESHVQGGFPYGHGFGLKISRSF